MKQSEGFQKTKPQEALLIVDRFLHGYTTEEICIETKKSKGNVNAYIAYYKARKGNLPYNSISISKDGADAICEKYGFEKDYSILCKWTPKQAEQKPVEEKVQEEQDIVDAAPVEDAERLVKVYGFVGEAKWVLHYLAQVKAALNDLCDKQDRTNELLTNLIDLLK